MGKINFRLMKKWIAGLIVAIGILTLVVSCPPAEEHRDAIKSIVKESLDSSDNMLIAMLGGYVVDMVAEEMVSCRNYVLFSTGYIEYEGEKQLASIGVLGHVFVLFDREDIDKLLEDL